MQSSLLTQAIRQAERMISGSWRLHGDCLASPAAFRLPKAPERSPESLATELAAGVRCEGTWFQKAFAEGGYLNLTFRAEWYAAIAAEPVPTGIPITSPVPPLPPFPAEILEGDWRWLCRTEKKTPQAALAARQDSSNPAWLVRYTAQRLEQLSERDSGLEQILTEGERKLLLRTAEYPRCCETNTLAQMGQYLTALAQAVWHSRVFTGSAARHCGRVLAAGYAWLSRL